MINLDFVSVPVIVTAVTGCLQLLKKAINGNEKVVRFFPVIAAMLGAALGIVFFYAIPDIMPATNVLVALLIGGSSGLAATGTHQVFKQLTKIEQKDENTDNAKDDIGQDGT